MTTIRDGINTPFLEITETRIIGEKVDNIVIPSEVPSKFYHVKIAGYSEVDSLSPTTEQFYVDYVKGYILFNSTESGKSVSINYMGTGTNFLNKASVLDADNDGIVDKANKIGNQSLTDLDNRYPSITSFNMYLAENAQQISDLQDNKADKKEVNSLATDKANKTDLDAQKARVDILVATSSGSYYEKCLNTDTGALLVVSSGATIGQINLASVTPVATGYTPQTGDYVRLVSGVAKGSTELLDIRVGKNGEHYEIAGDAIRKVQDVFSFVKSKNRLNPNTITTGYYYNSSNQIVTNVSYDLSDYIYVHNHVGETLLASAKEKSPSTFPGYMVFDINKNPIRRVTGWPSSYTVLDTDYYIRAWFTTGNASIYQYEFGTAITNFEPYFDDYYKPIIQEYTKPVIDRKYLYDWYRGDTDVTAGSGVVKHSSKLYRLSVGSLCHAEEQLKISMSDYTAYTFDLYFTDSNGIYKTGSMLTNNSDDVIVPKGSYFVITLKRVTENTSEVASLSGDLFNALSVAVFGTSGMKIVGYSNIDLSKLNWVAATLNYSAGYVASSIRMATGAYLEGQTIDPNGGFIPLPLIGTLKVQYTGNFVVCMYQYDENKAYKTASNYYASGDEIVLQGYPYARFIVKNNVTEANIGLSYVSSFGITLQYKTSNATESKELKPTKLRVMTNNVGVFNNGSSTEGVQADVNTALANWKAHFAEYMPDVLGLQEMSRYFDGAKTLPTYENLFKQVYPYAYMSTYTNALLSKYPIYEVETIMTGTISDTSLCRPLIKGYLFIDGKKICVVNCHLYYNNTTAGATERMAQINDILNLVANEDYVIIFGDFNNNFNGLTELSPFTNAGYKLVNGGYFSAIRTYNYNMDYSPTADTTKDLFIDNLIVSQNISINSRIIANDRVTSDHLAVISDLVIY